jgi:hypothetical protein
LVPLSGFQRALGPAATDLDIRDIVKIMTITAGDRHFV